MDGWMGWHWHVPLTSTTAPADDAQLYTYHAHHFIFSFTYFSLFCLFRVVD